MTSWHLSGRLYFCSLPASILRDALFYRFCVFVLFFSKLSATVLSLMETRCVFCDVRKESLDII